MMLRLCKKLKSDHFHVCLSHGWQDDSRLVIVVVVAFRTLAVNSVSDLLFVCCCLLVSVGAYMYVVMASLGQSVALLEGCRGGLAVSGQNLSLVYLCPLANIKMGHC